MSVSLSEAIARRPAVLERLPTSGLAYLLAREQWEQPLVVVCADEERAEQVAADLRAFSLADVQLFPGEPHLPFEDVSPDPHAVFARLSLRYRILAGDRPRILVASAAAVQGRWMSDEDFLAATVTWRRGEEVPREQLSHQLVRCGYQPVSMVEDEGTFAVRGGILDLFPPGRELPVRIDQFGEELSSLKSFDPASQRATTEHESLSAHPIREVVFDDRAVARALARLRLISETADVPTRRLHAVMEEIEQRNYFFGVEGLWPAFYEKAAPVIDTLLGPGAPLLVLDDSGAIHGKLLERQAAAEHERERAVEHHRLVLEVAEHIEPPEMLFARLSEQARVRTTPLAFEAGDEPLALDLGDWQEMGREMQARREDSSKGEILDPLVQELKRRVGKRHDLFLACGSRAHAERLRELLLGRQIDLPLLDRFPDPQTLGAPRRSPRLAVVVAALSAGIRDERGVAIISDVEIFGSKRTAAHRRRPRAPEEGLATLRDLTEGDPVIHVDHGIGRYLGLKRLILDGVDGDYVHLEYAGGDRLYLPIYRLSLLQRYRGPTDTVRLDKLGGTRWLRAKQRVKDAVLALAHELLALQARRRMVTGVGVPEPADHFRAFEATFPFEETPDQQRAIDEVLADLQQDKPMDRLVCGDVGFGKTEVAVRAAYLAAVGGKQVAVLVPTTVLAEQHGMTFRDRLQAEPVTVEVLSRFRPARETQEILMRLRRGVVDILIGTHRMLSHDVAFKNLGLLVVDEEQRFGVKQKERIKQLRSQVHVLTLSATPIPRTLNMAVSGLKELSIIQTPPAERVSIRTEVTRFDEQVVIEAIRRELHRGGQVFVVHNRIRSIGAMAELIKRLVPEAHVAVAHGQMSGDKLERIMVEFVRREHNVLVCTAIIESGIDIPTANTMIVNRADMFGLSQLYQLRGRIGRSRDRGYAYLLLPRGDQINREAMERLAVLKRFSELGSGFQIASHDLELRGAGDLLGADQSGHIAAVGFDLYTELLNEAVEQVKGQAARQEIEPEIKLPVAAVIPETYVPEPMARLAFYQRMAQSFDDAGIFDVFEEIEGLYGKAPDEVRQLVEVMVIRRRLKALGATSLSAAASDHELKLGLSFVPDPGLDQQALALRLLAEPERYRLLPSGRLLITLDLASEAAPDDLLRLVREEIGRLPAQPAAARALAH